MRSLLHGAAGVSALDAEQCLRDVVALSTLPAVWLGAEPMRIVESVAAGLFTVLEADMVYVCLQGDVDHPAIAVAQVGRNETDPQLAGAAGPALFEWARTHDPDELMPLAAARYGTFQVTVRALSMGAEYGIIAAGFLGGRTPTRVHQLLLNVGATQATTAIDNVRLGRSQRRYAAQLAGLSDVTRAMLHPALTMAEALELITVRARELVGAHQAVTSMTAGLNWAQAINAVSLSDKYAAYRDYAAQPDGSGIYAIVCRDNRPMRMTQPQLECHPAWRHFGAERGKHPPMRGWLAAPLVARDGTNLGLIQLSDKYDGEFTEHDEALIVQLASTAALIIERRAAEAAQQAAMREAEAARREAEAASRMKDEFLAMLGHELRNPLAPIVTALQLMRLRADGVLERERTVIERQVTHLTRLVDDLLDVSRIARGKVELRRERIDLAEVVAKSIELASPLLEQRRHSLDVQVPRELCVEADAMRLAQVVANLLTNAAKYTEPGGLVSVRAEHSRDRIRLAVRDTGIGIAPELLPRIFDLFVQGGQDVDRSSGGLGLGLTIVRSLVTMHGGTVSVSSHGPGHGSEFVVDLPSAPSAAPTPGAPARVTAAGGDVHQNGGTRVLVVDDNEDAAEMLVSALAFKGYVVTAAPDGPAALRIAASFKPQVALLDIGLPVMDGYELAERLHQLPQLSGIRLFAVTGYAQAADRKRSAAAGFTQHFAKPLDVDVLATALQEAVAHVDDPRWAARRVSDVRTS